MVKEAYFVECHCKHRVPVKLHHAGMSVTCSACKSDLRVPDTITLKQNSGDKYPFLTHVEKIEKTFKQGELPFDGVCHECGKVRAEVEVPIVLKTLVERQIADDGGIRLTLTGVKLVAGAAEEFWKSTPFSLQLCSQCYAGFQAAQSFNRFKAIIKIVFLFATLLGFLVLAYFNFELVAALSGILWFIGLVAWIAGLQGNNKVDAYLLKWLNNIRWVPEAIADATEFSISTGKPRSYVPGQMVQLSQATFVTKAKTRSF